MILLDDHNDVGHLKHEQKRKYDELTKYSDNDHSTILFARENQRNGIKKLQCKNVTIYIRIYEV